MIHYNLLFLMIHYNWWLIKCVKVSRNINIVFGSLSTPFRFLLIKRWPSHRFAAFLMPLFWLAHCSFGCFVSRFLPLCLFYEIMFWYKQHATRDIKNRTSYTKKGSQLLRLRAFRMFAINLSLIIMCTLIELLISFNSEYNCIIDWKPF